ncbi:extracellular solute-binding protein [Neobacillus drentensis]|uniref:ABC transporter substrate-binding protein n=1 Tax=Neobacillus drentensis TaxID=220684 RepID=UPI002FFE472C
MKKILPLMMSLIVMFSLSACSSGNTQTKESKNTEQNHSKNSTNDNGKKQNREDLTLKVSKDEKKTIVISVMGNTPFFEMAKKEYEKKHPNITIQIKGFTTKNMLSPVLLEKYLKTTSTEVLSGKGADLFVLNESSLPVDRFVDKKAFVNLNDYINIDTSFDKNQYYMNIIQNSKMNGGLYVLPTRFFLNALFVDQDAISKTGVKIDDKHNWTWSQFVEVSKQLKQKGTLEFAMQDTPDTILNTLVFEDKNFSQLVNIGKNEAYFNSKFFTDLLMQVKELYDENVLTEQYSEDGTYFRSSQIYSPKDYFLRSAVFYKNATIYQMPHSSDKESGVSFVGYDRYAMNANSNVKMEAWDYLKFLMSYDMQLQSQTSMFPINKAANEKEFAELKNGTKLDNPKGGQVTISEEALQPLKQMITEANTQVRSNDKIKAIISEESKSYFSGQKSAESVADIIQNRVMTYLNE